jgi:hypothetical protein
MRLKSRISLLRAAVDIAAVFGCAAVSAPSHGGSEVAVEGRARLLEAAMKSGG